MVNLLYPRTIQIRRPNKPATTAVGDVGFGGDDQITNETVILINIPANISYKGRGYSAPAELPTDSKGSRWVITLPVNAAKLGTIHPNDIAVDDTGLRYKVDGPDWQILGYELQCELLVI